jgi:hypothetical protein
LSWRNSLSNRKSGYELHHHSYVSFLSHCPRTNTRSGEILCLPFLFLSFHFGFPLFGSVGHVERPIRFHVRLSRLLPGQRLLGRFLSIPGQWLSSSLRKRQSFTGFGGAGLQKAPRATLCNPGSQVHRSAAAAGLAKASAAAFSRRRGARVLGGHPSPQAPSPGGPPGGARWRLRGLRLALCAATCPGRARSRARQ